MLFKAPDLDPFEEQVLSNVEKLKATLEYSLRGPGRWYGLLRRNTFARAVRGSNTIEGYNVTVDDAIAAVEGEEPLDPKDEAWAAVNGYRAAMTFVLQKADDPFFEYSPEVLKALHFMMIGYDLRKHPGKWRPGPIFVRNEANGEQVYEGPGMDVVPGLIDELMVALNDKADSTSKIVQAAMAHLNFVMIHPFSDGNGRMGRGLQTLVLARGGIVAPPFASIEEYLGRNTQPYYDVLAKVGGGAWHPERDTRDWVRFCLTAHFRQAMTLLRRSREIERIWSELEQLVKRSGLPERCIMALADAAVGLKVRNPTYRNAAEISENAASRDLKAMVDAGLLLPKGEKRGRFYIASLIITAIKAKFAESKMVPDPFVDRGIIEDANPLLPGL